MSRLVAVGTQAFVTALAGAGAEPVRCDAVGEFGEKLRKIALDREVRIVFAPESYVMESPDAVEAFRKRSKAALLGLPLRPNDVHPSLAEMRHLVEQATGASLI
jgi:vacuolar-type H+-ATPase subunit F/Vma7